MVKSKNVNTVSGSGKLNDLAKDFPFLGKVDARLSRLVEGATIREVRISKTHLNILLANDGNEGRFISIKKPTNVELREVFYELKPEVCKAWEDGFVSGAAYSRK